MKEDFQENLRWLQKITDTQLAQFINNDKQIQGPYDHPNLHHKFDQLHTQFDFKSKDGLSNICTYAMNSKKEIKAIVLFFHGMHSCSQTFHYTAFKLSQQGYQCYAMDTVCHGRSQGQKGLIPQFTILQQDAIFMIQQIKKKHQGKKVFVGGQSMGGLIATNLQLVKPGIIDGLILFAPAIRMGLSVSKFQLGLVKILSYLPEIGMIPQQLKQGTKHRLADQFRNNPLNYSGRLYPIFLRRIANQIQRVNKQVHKLKAPFIHVIGCKDKLVNPKSALDFERCESKDKTFLVYKNMWHVVTLEEQIKDVVDRLIKWLNQRFT